MGALNKNLVRAILEILAEANGNFTSLEFGRLPDYPPQDVRGYLLVMSEGALVKLGEPVDAPREDLYPLKVRITWGGYTWLESNPQ
ncbi:MAG: hypothetical protein AB7D51_01425 [Desulfovibrionaceae bacterium]